MYDMRYLPSLADLKPGEKCTVTRILGGYGLRQKLALRGVKEGSQLRVVSSSPGPVVVEVNGRQVALGRGVAQKVLVESVV